jgi:hypothetical protein
MNTIVQGVEKEIYYFKYVWFAISYIGMIDEIKMKKDQEKERQAKLEANDKSMQNEVQCTSEFIEAPFV